MNENTNQAMDQCLRAVWQRAQQKHVIGGLLAFVRWFIPLFLVVTIIDRYAYCPGWLRAVVALLLLGYAFVQGWRNGWSRLSAFNATRTAQQIERSSGGMDSLLVTALQFHQSGASPGTSQSMWEYTLRKAQTAAEQVEPQQVVPMRDLKKPLRIALGVAAVILLVALLNGSFLVAGLGRMFAPWANIAYPTDTIIQLGEGDMVVKEGAPALVEIKLSGDVPEDAELSLRTGEGKPREFDLEVVDGVCTYEIAAASRDFTYRVKAGDARSDWRQVRVVPAPRMSAVSVEVDYPDYIDRENEVLEAMTLTVPEETKVNWQLVLDTPISKATLHRDGEDDLPLEVGDDGRTLTLSETALASRGYSFSWVEKTHGFDFTSPRYFLQVSSDQAPRVELVSPVSNISAMLGRSVELVVRAQDDHGIGTTTVTYRVNRRPEKAIIMPSPVRSGEGEQKLDWDYRDELKDLKIGDSVSFVVEVADKYPGDGGPHKVRTDTRRISFLSREDYLAEITKQMERLLTRVRTLYRQERAAHELVMSLDPTDQSYLPTCQLEAIRQEMVREQLVTTADEVDALLADLAANKVSDAVESDMLATLRDALRAIATEDVARAADLLRAQVGAEERDPQDAISAVNKAARELAGLVLQRGIDASREVFARETRMLARELAKLRLAILISDQDQAKALADRHAEVAGWTDKLLTQLSDGMHYDKRPLAVLGLSRRIHDLRTNGLADSIRDVAKLTGEGNYDEAVKAQYPLIRPLLEAEFTMRSGSEFAIIRDLREQLAAMIAAQKELQAKCADESDLNEFAKTQADLRDRLVHALMPSIPAPRPGLFDLDPIPAPPSDQTRLSAESAMTEVVGYLKAGEKEQALAAQKSAIASMKQLDAILTLWSGELSQMSLGVSSLVSDATDRVGVMQQLEIMQITLIEHTEEAALDEKHPKILLEDQQALMEEVDLYRKDLSGGEDGPSRDALPLLARLEQVTALMQVSAKALADKRTEEALEPQENAADVLAEAREIAGKQLTQLNLLQQLIGFKQAVGNASNGMADVVGGQNDLIAATKVANEKELSGLLAPQRNLLSCLTDIAPSLDLVAARMDVGTPLVFAASDVEDALLAMEDGDGEDAADIQQIAVESLTKVQGLVAEISVQTGYIAEIVEFLQGAQSDAANLAFRQRQLRENPEVKDALTQQKSLASDAKKFGEVLTQVAGVVDFEKLDEKIKEKLAGVDLALDFNVPAESMVTAARQMEAGQPAAEAMLGAENALTANSDQLSVTIAMLNGLPSVVLTNAEPPELHRLIDVLDIASKHRALIREARAVANKDLPALTKPQQQLADELKKYTSGEVAHPDLKAAHEQMSPIGKSLTASRLADAGRAQLAADETLRHFIIQQALILNTAVVPPSSSDADVLTDSDTDDLYEADAAGFVADFVSGEVPDDKESEWNILGTRNRAALNQNFARELPLEYRATLKNYYERVAK